MSWQPIETAPMDVLILVGPTKRMGICCAMNHSRDGWVTETCSEWVSIYEPKHWMHLPEPPNDGDMHDQSPVFVAEVFPDWTTLQILDSGEAYAFNRATGRVHRIPDSEAPFVQVPRYTLTAKGRELLEKKNG